MKPKDDFSNALVEDFLSESANTFFGTRKQLEEMIAAFHDMAAELRDKDVLIRERAALLNFMLARGEAAKDFYRQLKLDAGAFATGIDFTDRVLPAKMPFYLSGRRAQFIKLVLGAYAELRRECHEYMHGRYFYDPEDDGREKVTIHYRQLELMTDLINDRVQKVNTEMSPVCVLQYARKFDPEAESRERITGGGTDFGNYACSIDKKLAYDPVNFELLNLKEYPDLPLAEEVKEHITHFCKNLIAARRKDIQQIISELDRGIQRATPDQK